MNSQRDAETQPPRVCRCVAQVFRSRIRSLARWLLVPVGLVGVALAVAMVSNSASGSPERDSEAPDIRLNDLNGIEVSTADLAPRVLVLIFGTLPHEGVQRACTQVYEVAGDRRLTGDAIVPILVVPEDKVAKPRNSDEMPSRLPAITLHDPDHKAFKAYKVVVAPTVVVVDPRGHVVHSMPGFEPRFREMLTASLLYAAGKESRQEFERIVDAKAQPIDVPAFRASRLCEMGDELAREGLYGWAASRYAEACLLDPKNSAAAIGAGNMMLRLNQIDEAEEKFTAVLSWAPGCMDAELGLAEVQGRRGGEGAAKAVATLRRVIESSPTHASAHLLLAEVLDRSGDGVGASAEYRRAAELALGR